MTFYVLIPTWRLSSKKLHNIWCKTCVTAWNTSMKGNTCQLRWENRCGWASSQANRSPATYHINLWIVISKALLCVTFWGFMITVASQSRTLGGWPSMDTYLVLPFQPAAFASVTLSFSYAGASAQLWWVLNNTHVRMRSGWSTIGGNIEHLVVSDSACFHDLDISIAEVVDVDPAPSLVLVANQHQVVIFFDVKEHVTYWASCSSCISLVVRFFSLNCNRDGDDCGVIRSVSDGGVGGKELTKNVAWPHYYSVDVCGCQYVVFERLSRSHLFRGRRGLHGLIKHSATVNAHICIVGHDSCHGVRFQSAGACTTYQR